MSYKGKDSVYNASVAAVVAAAGTVAHWRSLCSVGDELLIGEGTILEEQTDEPRHYKCPRIVPHRPLYTASV